jgi:pimeloyl-ACP methyl ester carboxylesterase
VVLASGRALLEEAGHEAIAVDLPGDDDRAGLSAYADRVLKAIGTRQVVLVVQALGGFTAPLVCARVRVRMLVFVNTSSNSRQRHHVVSVRAISRRSEDTRSALRVEDDQAAAVLAGGVPRLPRSPDHRVAVEENCCLLISQLLHLMSLLVIEGNRIITLRLIPATSLPFARANFAARLNAAFQLLSGLTSKTLHANGGEPAPVRKRFPVVQPVEHPLTPYAQ